MLLSKTAFNKIAFYSCLLIGPGIPSALFAQTLQYKAIWYRPAKDSLIAELADDTGSAPTPRYDAVLSLDQNFYGFAINLHANAVIVRLIDDDAYPSQYGGGFSYDPLNRPRPQFAVAQEIIAAVAAKYGMKVIFAINVSGYHVEVDDNFGNVNAGTRSWDFIHSLFDPPLYYGSLTTTQLPSVGLADRSVSSFVGDPRIAGWILGGEWALEDSGQYNYLANWWNDFYTLVHWGGANTAFAGTYPLAILDGVPDDPACGAWRLSSGGAASPVGRIQALKNFFAAQSVKPDLYGLEWYGNNSYRLSCISPDLVTLTETMRDTAYSIPTQNIAMMEGGTNQVSNPGLSQFYTDAINTAANVDGVPTGGVFVWNSDGNVNSGSCTTGDDPAQAQWALAKVSAITIDGCRTYSSAPPAGWHASTDPRPYPTGGLITNPPYAPIPTGFGAIYYYDMTPSGYALATAFGAH